MQSLNLPAYEVKLSNRNGQPAIYDFLRHCYLRLTPEEWVRQHFTHYLVEHKGYPAALLANEVTINVGGRGTPLRQCAISPHGGSASRYN